MAESALAAYDLLIQNARLFGYRGPSQPSSVGIGIVGDRIAAIGPQVQDATARFRIDAAHRLVGPALIELHGHFFPGGTPSGIDPDLGCLPFGVTTAVDGGSAGAHNFAGLVRSVFRVARTRTFAFLNLSAEGLSPSPRSGELFDLTLADVDLACETAARYPEYIVGFKVRVSGRAAGSESNAREALRRALMAGERTGLPIMVHIAQSIVPLRDVFDALRPGDIATHIYSGRGETVLEGGRVRDAIRAAAKRGVVLDVGHAAINMDISVARTCMQQDLPPTTLSTDAHRILASHPNLSVLDVVSQFVSFGMSLESALSAATEAPAAALRRSQELGRLAVGRVADIAILDVREEPRTFEDGITGEIMTVSPMVSAAYTIKGGRLFTDLL